MIVAFVCYIPLLTSLHFSAKIQHQCENPAWSLINNAKRKKKKKKIVRTTSLPRIHWTKNIKECISKFREFVHFAAFVKVRQTNERNRKKNTFEMITKWTCSTVGKIQAASFRSEHNFSVENNSASREPLIYSFVVICENRKY